MRRVLEIAVVAVATLGIVSVGLAGCCPPDADRCAHAGAERSAGASRAHCAPAPASAPSVESGCCDDPIGGSPDYSLTKSLPLPGAPQARSAIPQMAAFGSDAPRLAPGVTRPTDQHSPILRL